MFVRDARDVLLGGCWIFDGPLASVKKAIRARIVAAINGANLSGAYLYGAKDYNLPKGWTVKNGIAEKE